MKVGESCIGLRVIRSEARDWPHGRIRLSVDGHEVTLSPNQSRRLINALQEGIERAESLR